ncbi:hypothetical protein H6S82_05745, partial [Planktothrix sp. FACHB-1355]
MIDEVKQTDKTENPTRDTPEEILSDSATAKMDSQAKPGLNSEEVAIEENILSEVEAEADTYD